ncbi:hypothetical protein [Clostridium sp. AWRP]|uniref:hypothetical protein n=1 Tax=Clostridium sp. AWRP TaxID=2212991 RepID=UPI000FDAAD26|nr:hypothetical protein [Clostridium sp. AWRP]AZV58376.1 hypothetical protein DMR38_18275 [Clostridium sp. AWRP]
MDKKYEKVLGKQKYYFKYLNDLFGIINRSQTDRLGLSSLAIDCFNYGVMIGKRQQRKRNIGSDNI